MGIKTTVVTRNQQFSHSKMCIDHITGFKLKFEPHNDNSEKNIITNQGREPSSGTTIGENESKHYSKTAVPMKCYMGPGHINEQRKFKRRCLGIHPYPIFFER